jgi:hypothetical protein
MNGGAHEHSLRYDPASHFEAWIGAQILHRQRPPLVQAGDLTNVLLATTGLLYKL